MREHCEPHPDRLGVDREPPKPSAHRRHRHPNSRGRPAMPNPRRLRCQRNPDHLGHVATAQQAVSADQHMRTRAANASPPARTTALLTFQSAHRPPSRRPPRTQLTPATRARQLAADKAALDFVGVASYDLQQCLRASGRTLPSLPSDHREGPCASRPHDPVALTRTRPTRTPAPHHHHLRCRNTTAASSTNAALNTRTRKRPRSSCSRPRRR